MNVQRNKYVRICGVLTAVTCLCLTETGFNNKCLFSRIIVLKRTVAVTELLKLCAAKIGARIIFDLVVGFIMLGVGV